MTLCIAAIARYDKAIVTVCDHMLSAGNANLDSPNSKITPIGRAGRWFSMYGGDPTVSEMVNKAVCRRLTGVTPSLEQMAEFYRAGFGNALRQRAGDAYLNTRPLSWRKAWETGRAVPKNPQFHKIAAKADTFRLETHFLVGGFPAHGQPELFSVVDSTDYQMRIDYHKAAGFYAVGSGADRAFKCLFRTYPYAGSIEELVYRVVEAKFKAELPRRLGVGKPTLVCVASPSGTWTLIDNAATAEFRSFYGQKHKATKFPPNLFELFDRVSRPYPFTAAPVPTSSPNEPQPPASQSPSGTDSEAKQ